MSSVGGPPFRHAFVGGGIAASSLALRLAHDGPILIVEPASDDPRSFAFWSDQWGRQARW